MSLIQEYPNTYTKYRHKGEADGTTVTVDFNTPLTSVDRSSRQKITKATAIPNDIREKLDFTDIFRTLHPKNQNIHSFHQTFREELIPILLKLFQKSEGTLPKTFSESTIPQYHNQAKILPKKKIIGQYL